MRSGHKLELFTEETAVHGPEFRRPAAALISREWPVKGSSDNTENLVRRNGRTTIGKQSWGGAESPVSVIGHNMMMQGSSNPSSGSASMEHPILHFTGAAPILPSHLSHRSCQQSLSTDSQVLVNDQSSDGNYADLLSERVQQAFRKSHELQPNQVKKTWPAPNSAITKRIEWLNLQEDAQLTTGKYPVSKVFQQYVASTTDHATQSKQFELAASSSEEERLCIYRSTRDGQVEDDDSVIDFFPSRPRNTSRMRAVRSNGKMNEVVQDSSWRGSLKRSSFMRSAAGAGDHHHQYRTGAASEVAVDESSEYNYIERGRVSTSYKWDDAERWLTSPTASAAPPPPPPRPQELHQSPLSSNVDLHGLVKAACFQVQARKPVSGPICTQDKYIPDVNGREAGIDQVRKESKRDIATQSTPAEWSRCDSPEEEPRAIILMSSATTTSPHQKKPSLQHDSEEAPAQKTSPPRHNTPARRSVSCTKERGSCRNPLRPCEPVHFKSGKLNLLELESCHLDKLKLARDLPLGTSSTWVLFGEDGESQAEAKGKASPPPNPHSTNNNVKVNMVEARVSAWEDVERAKHIAKFKREEAKIEAWESLQRAEGDAELQKLEVKLEKMRFEGREKILGRLGASQRRAQDMRGVAEAQKVEQLTRVAMRANQIRKSGHLPSSTFNVMCSLTTKIKPSSNLSFS